MRHLLRKAVTARSLGCALALTVSVLSLSGCVSAAKETAEAASAAEQDVPEVAGAGAEQPAAGPYQDQQVAAVGANPQQQQQMPAQQQQFGYPQQNAIMPMAANSEPGSLTMQSTGLKATSSSIFSVQTPNAMPAQGQATATGQGTVPLPVGQNTGVNPASNSLFNGGQPASGQTPLPLEGASNTEGSVDPAQQMASAAVDSEGTPLPVSVPIPSSGDAMRVTSDAQPAAVQTAFADTVQAQTAIAPDSGQSQDENDSPDQAKKTLTLAGLFAAKRRNKNQFDNDRFAKAPAKKTQISMQQPQIAALGFTALPGVQTTSMFATTDDSDPGHDDESPVIEQASLSGLARLAPNGLWLQTEKVETGCFKPDLLQVLNVVETHYGRKIMVTSGLRDVQHNRRAGGRPHSRHTTCEAADIQVPGVSKWDLAQYLRTIPGRGGVGTYCHTESVHIDTGEARDWNWRCRRRRG